MTKPEKPTGRQPPRPSVPRQSVVEQQLAETDGLANRRADLPPGTLAGPPPDPQGDENRSPPPIEESGRGKWARRMDLSHDDVTPAGNRAPEQTQPNRTAAPRPNEGLPE